MNNINIENKLTPAAKNALEEIIKDYRKQILLSASKIATDVTGKLEEISIRDILKAIEETDIKTKDKKTRRRERIYSLLILTGSLYAIMGVAISVALSEDNVLNFLYKPGILISFIGIFIAITAYLMQRYRRQTFYTLPRDLPKYDYDLKDLNFMFISNWREIEIKLRDLYSASFGESNADIPLFKMFRMFVSKSILSEKDFFELKRLLDIRNNIMHSYKEYNRDDLQDAIKESEKLLESLRITRNSTGRLKKRR